jgi:hypothetical protein
MKNLTSNWAGKTERVSFCSIAGDERQKLEIGGRVLVPDADTAYVEFFLSHTWPVVNLYHTAILPQVVANSYPSLVNKVFNLAHLMRRYNPDKISKDHILGTVIAVEFVDGEGKPVTGTTDFKIAADKSAAQGIRAVAAMHKSAENVLDILQGWFTGQNPQGGEWTVSIENSLYAEDCGWLVATPGQGGSMAEKSLGNFIETTPAAFREQGWIYCPCVSAPADLQNCLNNAADDERDGINSIRVCRDYMGHRTILLLGGLDGKIRYRGVGLTPAEGARENEARVRTMLASAPMVNAQEAVNPLLELGEKIFG